MIIERNLTQYIVFSEDSLLNALRKISDNKSRLIFSVTESGQLEGVLTDGDLRRWLLSERHIDLDRTVSSVSNKNYVYLDHTATHEEIDKTFDERVTTIPLLDKHHHLVAFAQKKPSEFKIGDYIISRNTPAFIIAEIGNNHNGDLDLAYKLVDHAIEAGANCAKFQLRDMRELYRKPEDASDISEDLGAQYTLDLLSKFQLSTKDMFKVFDYCKHQGILPLCTPWDEKSLATLENYNMPAYKLASADLTNHDLLVSMAHTGKPMICSTGMSNESEIEAATRILREANANFVLLHCNSTYPTPFKDINLNYLERLKQIGECQVGYSGHERGISIALAAIAKGAKIIEKHLTLDRNMEGNDHRVSLLPCEFKKMTQGIREIEQALGSNSSRKITQGELINRETLAKSLIINRPLDKGKIITEDMIETKSPGKGLPPYKKEELIGKEARRDFQTGDFFYISDIRNSSIIKPRNYRFSRPFGIPVRYHDLQTMAVSSNFDLLEFHFSYKDIEENPENYFSSVLELDFVVHSPELFSGDHIMDLCSPDKNYRQRSIDELQRVVDLTRKLTPYFKEAHTPKIVINAGGSTLDSFIPVTQRQSLYDTIAESLERIDQTSVEIIPQTMPPFPWHFGGQRYHNLFMTPDDIENFCSTYKYRICLDISHSQLTCNHFGLSFRDFLNQVGPYTAHLHIVDAEGVDGEGLQIGDGSIDFGMVSEVLSRTSPNTSFIPEIWQGHNNNGEGFWYALDRLEQWF